MGPSVVVIGNFDGVHLGHQAVLRQARAIAHARSLRCVVLTFEPHPAEVLGRGAPPRLTTLARRCELLRLHGASDVVVEPFTLDFASWTPDHFARELLERRLAARVVVVGRNFRFGHERSGNFDTLKALGESLGFEATAAEVASDADGPFSSTRVRDAIAAGDLETAVAILSRPHALSGVVAHGDARGRTIGFPTANMSEVHEMLPPRGVYAVRVVLPGAATSLGGVMNIGIRPTVDGSSQRIEVHLFDFEGDLYGQSLRADLVAHLRDERKFASLSDLQEQIARDAENARNALASAGEQALRLEER